MSAGLLAFLLITVFALSWYTAWGVGRYWIEAKVIGGWIQLLVGVGVGVAALGFTWVYLTLLTVFATGAGYLTVEQAQVMYGMGYFALGGPIAGSASAILIHSRVLAFRRRVLCDPGLAAYKTFRLADLVWRGASNNSDPLGGILDGLGVGPVSRSAKIEHPPESSSGTGFVGAGTLANVSKGGKSGHKGFGGGGHGGSGSGGGGKDGAEAAIILLVVILFVLAICGGVITTVLIVRHADRVHVVDVTRFFDVMNGDFALD